MTKTDEEWKALAVFSKEKWKEGFVRVNMTKHPVNKFERKQLEQKHIRVKNKDKTVPQKTIYFEQLKDQETEDELKQFLKGDPSRIVYREHQGPP